jgi:hypothetical protein
VPEPLPDKEDQKRWQEVQEVRPFLLQLSSTLLPYSPISPSGQGLEWSPGDDHPLHHQHQLWHPQLMAFPCFGFIMVVLGQGQK